MEITKATANDFSKIAENEKNSFSIPLSENEIREISENELYEILVLKDTEYIGHTVFYTTERVTEIVSVAIKDPFRNKGFGKVLVKEIIKNTKDISDEILLDVRISNLPAISLYKSCGFEIIAERKNFYEKPTENAYTMKFSQRKA